MNFTNAYEKASKERMRDPSEEFLHLGAPVLDSFFGGGLPLGKFVEVYGMPGDGKTLFALQIARLIMEDSDREVLYIDAATALSSTSLSPILKKCDGKRFGIRQIQAFETLDRALTLFLECPKLALVIIDALPWLRPKRHLSANLTAIRSEARSRMAAIFLAKYKSIAAKKSCSFLFINEMRSRGEFGPDGRWLVDAAGSKAERYSMDYRILLTALPGSWDEPHLREGKIELKAVKDKLLGNQSTRFTISYSNGIQGDLED